MVQSEGNMSLKKCTYIVDLNHIK